MRISETECSSNICLSKFKFNCDEINPNIPDPLPKNMKVHMILFMVSSSAVSHINGNTSSGAFYTGRRSNDRTQHFGPCRHVGM